MDSCDGTEPREFRRGITEKQGTQLLIKDMERARWSVTAMTSVHLTDGQYAALCDFVYNVGGTNLRKSTLLKLVNQRQFDRVPAQLRRWVIANGREVRGLKARREREIELFFEGVPIPRAAPLPGEDLSPIDVRAGQ
jgi:GH24 family phage-related lysozyme (muramidase)